MTTESKTMKSPTDSAEVGIAVHPLVRLLMNYDNCPDDAVDAAAALVEKLVETHNAAGSDWELWVKTRSVDWFDEVADLLRPFEANDQDKRSRQTTRREQVMGPEAALDRWEEMNEYHHECESGSLSSPCSRLPFTPPFRVISEYRCGTDAHVVDAAGNIIIEVSTWVSNPEANHKAAMLLIVDALNEKFPENAEV